MMGVLRLDETQLALPESGASAGVALSFSSCGRSWIEERRRDGGVYRQSGALAFLGPLIRRPR